MASVYQYTLTSITKASMFKRWATSLTACLLVIALTGCAGYADAPRQKSGVETYGVIDIGVSSHR